MFGVFFVSSNFSWRPFCEVFNTWNYAFNSIISTWFCLKIFCPFIDMPISWDNVCGNHLVLKTKNLSSITFCSIFKVTDLKYFSVESHVLTLSFYCLFLIFPSVWGTCMFLWISSILVLLCWKLDIIHMIVWQLWKSDNPFSLCLLSLLMKLFVVVFIEDFFR